MRKQSLIIILFAILIFDILPAQKNVMKIYTNDGDSLVIAIPNIDSLTYEEGCVDFDGYMYKTVKIGNQVWMAENLKVKHYRNGEEIVECYVYRDIESNADEYGRLYSWNEVVRYQYESPNSGYEIIPEGWHVPTDAEWEELAAYINTDNGGTYTKTDDDWEFVGIHLKSSSGWGLIVPDYKGTDDYNFTGVPAGYWDSNDINVHSNSFMQSAHFWSLTSYNSTNMYGRNLLKNSAYLYRDYYNKDYYLSIRCVKDVD